MNNLEEQQGESQLLGIMKKNLEEEPEDDGPNKFPQNFHPLNSEHFNNNISQDNNLNKNKQDTEPNYDDFLNSGGDKLISGLSKLNLGNNTSNQAISPKKQEQSNYFQNPMINMNMNNKSNQKDLAFNYYFGSGMQGDPSKKGGENNTQTVSSQFLEHLGLTQNDSDMNEPQFKNYFNNQINDNTSQNDNDNVNEKDNDIYQLNQNNMSQNPQGKMMMNMNFQNRNNQKINLNDNMMKPNQDSNKMNNINMNNRMIQMSNNMNNLGNIPYNKMDPRIRNMLQQNMMMNNMMMGNNNMQMNPNQNQQFLMNNQNNMNMNQKNKNKKKKNKNNKNNNSNNVNIQNMNLIMNQQQPQMINYQNYNQFIPNQNIQGNNSMMNINQGPLNFNKMGFIPNNNNQLKMNLNNLNNIQNYNMNISQQNKYMPQSPNDVGFIPNSIQLQMMNNNLGMGNNFSSITLDQIINRSNNSFPGKFYVIKSIDESNILSSIRFKIWCSTIKGNQKLQKAYKEADKKYPIFLFFSVNGSGKFMGIALMNSDVEYKVNFNYWSQNDKWKGFFLVEWICIKDVPNRMFRSIINDLNENKPVTSSRDTQEICTNAGLKMLKVFKDYPQESTIFDSQPNEVKYMLQQNENNSMGNMGNMNNTGNMNNMGNMGNFNNMGNINNIPNMGNMGNYNQMMKMNARNMEMNYGNNMNNMNNRDNNIMINNSINPNINPNNPGAGNDLNNFGKIPMEMNKKEKMIEKEDDKINPNEQYDFNNILSKKNPEDEVEDNNQ